MTLEWENWIISSKGGKYCLVNDGSTQISTKKEINIKADINKMKMKLIIKNSELGSWKRLIILITPSKPEGKKRKHKLI